MAIIGPADLPVVLKLGSDPIKKYVLTKLGHPVVSVEITEDQLETLIRTSGDWISGYFPKEQKLAVFYTSPLQPTYPMPDDAYWVQEVAWDPVTTRIDDVFGAESFLFNVGQVSGIQNMLLDYHLLQAYRKFCVDIETTCVLTPSGLSPISQIKVGDKLISRNDSNKLEECVVSDVFDNGIADCFMMTLDDGKSIIATSNHRMFTTCGLLPIEQIVPNDSIITIDNAIIRTNRVSEIKKIEKRRVIDLCVPPYHNYFANGMLSHNSQKVLGTEGHWEVLNEGGEGPTKQLIRLYPTPKGVFPVTVLYYPVVTHFRSPVAKKLCMDMILAESKIVVGMARRKVANMPSPTGGTMATDGDALITEGNKELDEITKKAINLGEPLGIYIW